MLPWLVAMPAERQLGMVSLILSGALERIPKSLRICFAHGDGSFTYLLGRGENAWMHRDDVAQASGIESAPPVTVGHVVQPNR